MPYISIFEISYMIAATIGFLHYHARSRQRMLWFKVVAALLGAFYFWGIGAETAMLAGFIAALGGFVQAVFPDHLLQKTRLLRTGVAVGLAGTAILLAAGSALEALPLMATICSRFSEVQACQQRIRMGWVLSQTLWITFAVLSGLILLYITENLNLLSNLKAIWKHEQGRKKLVPVPAFAS